jgi:hypothetical protein
MPQSLNYVSFGSILILNIYGLVILISLSYIQFGHWVQITYHLGSQFGRISSKMTHPNSLWDSNVATPLWGKCVVAIHTPENGTWESFGTPKNSEFDCRGRNTSPWDVLYTVGKLLKCTCPKWPRMNHLNICSTSYGRKKGRESNWQFHSWSLKVRNRPDPGVCRSSATHRWKVLKESYKFALDLIPIGGLSKKLWMPKVSGVQTRIVSGLHFGSPGKNSHLDVGAVE